MPKTRNALYPPKCTPAILQASRPKPKIKMSLESEKVTPPKTNSQDKRLFGVPRPHSFGRKPGGGPTRGEYNREEILDPFKEGSFEKDAKISFGGLASMNKSYQGQVRQKGFLPWGRSIFPIQTFGIQLVLLEG